MFLFLLLMNSMIPIVMIVFGFLWKKHPPKNRNWVYGYRTHMSMKSDQAWNFAHAHNAKTWRISGVTWLVISIFIMILFKEDFEKVSEWISWIGLSIMLLSLIPTEVALRKKFDENGRLR